MSRSPNETASSTVAQPRGLSPHVVVTGGSGFLGSRLVCALRDNGYRVTNVDLVPGAPGVHTVVGDIADPGVCAEAVTPDVQAIVHLAACTSVLRSVETPAETVRTNVEATAGLLELARQQQVSGFVLASTNAVVGDVGRRVITEESPLTPLTPYGASKAAAEMLVSAYGSAYQMDTSSLRFTNIYGPGMMAKDSFVPRLMRAARGGGGVEVYGDGEQVRDLVHVDDAVQAIRLALEGKLRGTVIVGSGRSVSVNELVAAVRGVTGAPLPVRQVPPKPGEMPAVIVDISRASDCGYEPQYALESGLATVWDDFRAAG